VIGSSQVGCVPNAWCRNLGCALYVVIGVVCVRDGIAGYIKMYLPIKLEDLLEHAACWAVDIRFVLD
jgi:hypothetical protein